MESKAMKILIIEDDIDDCNRFVNCIKERKDIELVGITDSDIEGLKYVKLKHPEGIVLDLELNNSTSGNTDSLEFLLNLKKLNLNYVPIVIVTTHVNSKRTYEILHRNGVDLILYKDHPNYSCNQVLNKFINLRKIEIQSGNTGETVEVTEEEVISQIADILSLEFEKGEKSNDSTGWSYSVRWYDTEGKQIDTVVIMNDGTIEKDGYFWKTSKDNIS